MNINKSILRKEMLCKREMITEELAKAKSKAIMNEIIKTVDFKNSRLIMCYIDFRHEVMTKDFIKYCLKEGKRVAVPIIMKGYENKREMCASEIFDVDQDTETGTFGILEPKQNRIRKINPKDIDLVIVPGIAFDASRNRLGYGAGFYDRFLTTIREDCYTIAIAFDHQIVEEVPVDEFDIAPKKIVTEARWIE